MAIAISAPRFRRRVNVEIVPVYPAPIYPAPVYPPAYAAPTYDAPEAIDDEDGYSYGPGWGPNDIMPDDAIAIGAD